MKTRILKLTSVIALAVIAALTVTFSFASGQKVEEIQSQSSDSSNARKRGQKLVGTWDVTLRFPVCSATCPCPGGTPNIPIPALQTYSNDGTMVEVSGGTLFRGPALGSWEHTTDQQYSARYAFFIFNSAGARILKEVVTSQIDLQGRDAFEATATFDLFAADGTPIPSGCQINITGTRF